MKIIPNNMTFLKKTVNKQNNNSNDCMINNLENGQVNQNQIYFRGLKLSGLFQFVKTVLKKIDTFMLKNDVKSIQNEISIAKRLEKSKEYLLAYDSYSSIKGTIITMEDGEQKEKLLRFINTKLNAIKEECLLEYKKEEYFSMALYNLRLARMCN